MKQQFIPRTGMQPAAEDVREVCERFSVRPLTARALLRLGLSDYGEMEAFLNPDLAADLEDPFLLPDMDRACERILRAASYENAERVCVFGDYDADGVCATALLTECLLSLDIDCEWYVPDRHTEGYGISAEAVRKLKDRGVSLIITVDNGITAFEAADACKELGIDLIVTDHHLCGEILPEAYAIVSAKLPGSLYPNTNLCGCGVAFKLACALTGDEFSEKWLSLTAIATVADIVPLIGENRTIVCSALDLLRDVDGINALLVNAGAAETPVNAETIGFVIGPRLNAAGRMGDAGRAVELLLSGYGPDIRALAEEIEAENRLRREKEQQILSDVSGLSLAATDNPPRAIVLHGANWHIGVIGNAASKLVDRFHCPVLLFGERDGQYIGSCRSVPGVNLFECLTVFKDRFVRFGGHAQAAGITITPGEFELFQKEFPAYVAERYPAECFTPSLLYDDDLSFSDMTVDAFEDLKKLEPCGNGNPTPVFRVLDADVLTARKIGKNGEHVAAELGSDGKSVRAVWFSPGTEAEKLTTGARRTLLVLPKLNTFRGSTTAELGIVAVSTEENELFTAVFEHTLYHRTEECAILFKLFFEAHGCIPVKADDLQRLNMGKRFSLLKIRTCNGLAVNEVALIPDGMDIFALTVFLELGFFAFDSVHGTVSPVLNPASNELTNSAVYRMAQTYFE